jgi:hypothetical protein
VPQSHLLIRQSIEKLLGDDVFDTDEASIHLRTIEDGALSHVLVVVHAVVVRLHLPTHVVHVKMESTWWQWILLMGLKLWSCNCRAQRDMVVSMRSGCCCCHCLLQLYVLLIKVHMVTK